MNPATLPPTRSARSGRFVLGGLLVLVGVGWLVESTTAVELPWRLMLPVVLILIGIGLVIGSRSGAGQGGLIALGAILTVLLALGTGFDVSIGGGVGRRVEAPRTLGDSREIYDLAVGDLTVDLRETRFLYGESVDGEPETTCCRYEVEAGVGIGHLVVLVPDDLPVRVKAESGIGEVALLEEREGGLGVESTFESEGFSEEAGLYLELSVGIGQIEVRDG